MTETQAYPDGARLLADIGGTNARFALETAPHRFEAVAVLSCKGYPSLQEAIAVYLARAEVKAVQSTPIRRAAIAIANPVDGDTVQMTNHHWVFSIEALRQELDLETLVVVNDFTALAMALPHLSAEQKMKVGGGAPLPGHPIGLIGPGTGLGVSGIIPSSEHWLPLASEGGHVTFSPVDESETAILRFCWREHKHVSAERLVSGMGLELIYRALNDKAGNPPATLDAAEIGQRAVAGSDAVCVQTVETFCAMLGTVAGNVAMTLGAVGGMYIGGGIVPRFGKLFADSAFRARFEAKGRFANYLAQIPTYVITAEYPAFLGVSAILAEKLG